MKGNMSQSRSEQERRNAGDIYAIEQTLKNKVDNSRKVNGQTLDNDVNITNVESAENAENSESADRLKTPRTINGVEFDGTKDIKVLGEGELPIQATSIYTAGWYRFAQISSSSTTAVIRIARSYGNGHPEVYTVIMNSTYASCNFIQLSSQGSVYSKYISKIRAVYNAGTIFLEFYYNVDILNSVSTKISDITLSHITDNFSNIAVETGSIPDGYSVVEFDLSLSPLKVPSLDIGSTTITETQLKALLALLT